MKKTRIACMVLVFGLAALSAQAYLIKVDFNDNVPLANPSEWNELTTTIPGTLNDTTGAASPVLMAFAGNWNPGSATVATDAGAWAGTDWEEASRDFFANNFESNSFGTVTLSGFSASDVVTIQVVSSLSSTYTATHQIDGLPATGPGTTHDGVAYEAKNDGWHATTGGQIMEWQVTGNTSYEYSVEEAVTTRGTCLLSGMSIDVIPEPSTIALLLIGFAGLFVRRVRRG